MPSAIKTYGPWSEITRCRNVRSATLDKWNEGATKVPGDKTRPCRREDSKLVVPEEISLGRINRKACGLPYS